VKNDLYVLEWSRKSNGFHIQKLEHTLAGNQKCFIANTSHDYIVLMVGDQDACDRMADNWRHRLQSREQRLHAVI
jgi:hypothetical protein